MQKKVFFNQFTKIFKILLLLFKNFFNTFILGHFLMD